MAIFLNLRSMGLTPGMIFKLSSGVLLLSTISGIVSMLSLLFVKRVALDYIALSLSPLLA